MNESKYNSNIIAQTAISSIRKTDNLTWKDLLYHNLQYYTGVDRPYIGHSDALESALMAAKWEPFQHPYIPSALMGFKAPIDGVLSFVTLEGLDDNIQVTLTGINHNRTMTVDIHKKDVPSNFYNVDHTVLMVGIEESELTVFTFHPGPPMVASGMASNDKLLNTQITVKEAIKMGLSVANLV